MTGLLPAAHGVYDDLDVLSEEHQTLAVMLRAKGFRTGAFVGNSGFARERGLSSGFEHYTKRFETREGSRGRPENSAAALNEAALDWLGKLGANDRFFLWIHYQEPHGPYEPPGFVAATPADGDPPDRVLSESNTDSGRGAIPGYQWLGHGRRSEYQARYDAEIAEVDRRLGELQQALEDRGLLAGSLMIVTADHGEAFGEDDLHCAHGEGLSDALLRVPLFLRLNGLPARLRTERVRLIDVVPTVSLLLDLSTDKLPGYSLIESHGDRPLIAQVGRLPKASWRRGIRGYEEIRETRGDGRLDLGFDVDPDGQLSVLGEAQLGRMTQFLRRGAPWPPYRSKDEIEQHGRP
jgi:arylsulfatase